MTYSGPWRVVKSLTTLRLQLDAAFPGRSHASDGTIADDAHSTTSDHYPHTYPALGTVPVVCAFDGTQDPTHGCDNAKITEAMRVSRDPRIKYVIWNHQMYSNYSTSTRSAWTWGPYTGSDDPHTNHFHVSTVNTSIADSTQPWSIGAGMALTPDELATLNQIKSDCAEMVLGSVTTRNAQIYWLRSIAQGTAFTSPLGVGKPGIPQVLAAIEEIALADAQLVADALAANDVWTQKIIDGVAAGIGAKLGSVLIDVLNTTTITGKLVTPDE